MGQCQLNTVIYIAFLKLIVLIFLEYFRESKKSYTLI